MQLSFTTKDATSALRCETNAGGSIYGRHTDISLARFPVLTWRWFVELPISSEHDERTPEGDDHPVRFFLEFRDSEGGAHHAEIIWANRVFKRGDWKYIGKFPHYVADGGTENVGRWRNERAHLLDIYRNMTKRTDTPRLIFLALFCKSMAAIARGGGQRLRRSAIAESLQLARDSKTRFEHTWSLAQAKAAEHCSVSAWLKLT